MKSELYIERENLLLINFDSILKSIEVDLLNDLDLYGLIKDYKIDLSKKDTKKLLYHHMIHGICEEIRLTKHRGRKIIVIPPTLRPFHDLIKFCDPEHLDKLMNTLIKTLNNGLPFVVFKANDYIFEAESMDSGEIIELTSILSSYCDTAANKKFTFERIKKFSTDFELVFLSDEYFNSIKTANLFV